MRKARFRPWPGQAWDHDPVRGSGHRGRLRDLQPAPQAPCRRVQDVAAEFRTFLAKIDSQVPGHQDVHLIRDNYQTPTVKAWLQAHPRFHMHFTPTYSSWLNQVERFFGVVTEDLLRRSDHRSVQALETDIRGWLKAWNETPNPSSVSRPPKQILESVGRLLKRISGAGH